MLAEWVLVASRAPAGVWGLSTPAACLLLSKFAPAAARLFAEFWRLRDGLPPVEARNFAEYMEEDLQDAQMMTVVRLCVCHMSNALGSLQSCRACATRPLLSREGVLFAEKTNWFV